MLIHTQTLKNKFKKKLAHNADQHTLVYVSCPAGSVLVLPEKKCFKRCVLTVPWRVIITVVSSFSFFFLFFFFLFSFKKIFVTSINAFKADLVSEKCDLKLHACHPDFRLPDGPYINSGKQNNTSKAKQNKKQQRFYYSGHSGYDVWAL